MAKPNYQQQKNQKDQAKRRKKEEKLKRKSEKREDGDPAGFSETGDGFTEQPADAGENTNEPGPPENTQPESPK